MPPYVKAVVEKLKKAKEAIDAGDVDGAGAISWTDLIYLSGKVTSQAAWKESKVTLNPRDGHIFFLAVHLHSCIPASSHEVSHTHRLLMVDPSGSDSFLREMLASNLAIPGPIPGMTPLLAEQTLTRWGRTRFLRLAHLWRRSRSVRDQGGGFGDGAYRSSMRFTMKREVTEHIVSG